MPLSPDFQFSQGSLQDFVDCQRRFELRYLLELAWPAVQAEPALEAERHLQQGALFHRLVQQHLLGVPAERLTPMVERDEDLAGWWTNYLKDNPVSQPGQRFPEVALSAPLAGQRLMAKYDLITVTREGRAVIFDWKTSHKRTPRQWLIQRLQTRVYPYLLVLAGAELNGGRPIQPDQVEMLYWFAAFPERPERFIYSVERFEDDGAYLTALARQISQLSQGEDPWPLTPDGERCRFCVYRSLCERGKEAGAWQEVEAEEEFSLEPELAFDLDFEQVAEVEY